MKTLHFFFAPLVALVAFGTGAPAHEGHDLPGTIQPQHGGVIKATQELYLELVQQGDKLVLHATDHDRKPIEPSRLKMEATAQLPRTKVKSPVKLKARDGYFEGTFDAKGAHRFTLEVTAVHHGKKEKAEFQVEPQL